MAGKKPIGKRAMAKQKGTFLAAYLQTATVSHACAQSGINRRTVYRWMKTDKAFQQAYDEAQEEAVELLEQEARRRALHGVEEPVFHQGMQCGTVKKYSDTLLIFLLNAARPEKYRPNQKDSGEGGNVTIIVQQFTQQPQPATPKVIVETKQLGGIDGSTELSQG